MACRILQRGRQQLARNQVRRVNAPDALGAISTCARLIWQHGAMSFRFYRRLRIAPGFTLNLSKRGASLSAGVRGAHYTAGTHGTRTTLGLPGSGISYTATHSRRRRRSKASGGIFSMLIGAVIVYVRSSAG